ALDNAGNYPFSQNTLVDNVSTAALPSGNLVIQVKVEDPDGCPTPYLATVPVYVKPAPPANITNQSGISSFCDTLTMSANLVVNTNLANLTYQWQRFGINISGANGTTYNANQLGTYTVLVTDAITLCTSVSNPLHLTYNCGSGPGGCTPPSHSMSINVNTNNTCNSFTFTAQNIPAGSNFNRWVISDLGNLNHTSYNNPETYTFPGAGYYMVYLYAEENGCSFMVQTQVVVEAVADFDYKVTCGPAGSYLIDFIDQSNFLPGLAITGITYKYNGSTITPPYNFGGADTYNVEMEITYTGGINGSCKVTLPVEIKEKPIPNFTLPTPACIDVALNFNGLITNAANAADVLNWLWDFGDDALSGLQNSEKVYSAVFDNPLASISLSIMDAYGCFNVVNNNLYVSGNGIIAEILMAPNIVCEGTASLIEIDGSQGSPLNSYLWNTGETTASINGYKNGDYKVTVGDNFGCIGYLAPKNLTVIATPQPIIAGKLEYCEGDKILLSANVGSSFQYDWVIDAPTGTLPHNGPVYELSNAAAYTYDFEVTLSGTNNCTALATQTVAVYPAPTVTVTGPAAPLCEGTAHLLEATTTAAHINWSTGETTPTIIGVLAGLYRATVTDTNGCKAYDEIAIMKVPDVSGFISGCYEICQDDEFIITMADPNLTYLWYKDGVLMQNGGHVFAIASWSPAVNLGSGIYTVTISNGSGCFGTSPPLDLTIDKCVYCGEIMTMAVNSLSTSCIPVDAYGKLSYTWQMQLNYGGNMPASFTLNGQGGQISNINTNVVSSSTLNLSGTFHPYQPFNDTAYFKFKFMFDDTLECIFNTQVIFEPCLPCEIYELDKAIECIGIDQDGNAIYKLDFGVENNSGTHLEYYVTSSSGTYQMAMQPVLQVGSNQVSGFFKMPPPLSGPFCIIIHAFSNDNQLTCETDICFVDVEDCNEDLNPCNLSM
ncbi:MAG: hypothetical protein H0X62_12795, partial [Bacteroidetes bacterium]|nr:hypothetical protein [Bacteroidota bacterium]